jgi:Putative Mg2+ and Co2+ transporter CorC
MSDFAVRWRLGGMKDFNERMSRWHATGGDGIKTECGLIVPVFGYLPETFDLDGYQNKITCKNCQKVMTHAR